MLWPLVETEMQLLSEQTAELPQVQKMVSQSESMQTEYTSKAV